MKAEALVIDALGQLGIKVHPLTGAPGQGADLVLDPEGVAVHVEVKQRSLVTDDVAARLLADRPPGSVLLVVGDRVTAAARSLLTSRHAGYYDLRGRLALRGGQIVIDAEVEPIGSRAERTNALSGPAGLEVAAALLLHPERQVAVRELAREIGRSPSTVSEILAALRQDGLVDGKNTVLGTQLFWRLADRWKASPTYLAELPRPGNATLNGPLHLGLADIAQDVGWALSGSVAAAAYGAPVAVRSDQVRTFYVPDQALVRRATTLLGAASSVSTAACSVQAAPVPAVCRYRVDLDSNPTEWPLAQPLFVALDLARDIGRGREILDTWTPAERWARVW